jgi:hypothetical protein
MPSRLCSATESQRFLNSFGGYRDWLAGFVNSASDAVTAWHFSDSTPTATANTISRFRGRMPQSTPSTYVGHR